jgi:hypothetical protein
MKIKSLSLRKTSATRPTRATYASPSVQQSTLFRSTDALDYDVEYADDLESIIHQNFHKNLSADTKDNQENDRESVADLEVYEMLLQLTSEDKQSLSDSQQRSENHDTFTPSMTPLPAHVSSELTNVKRAQTMIISQPPMHLSIQGCAWEILWITLKLAKVFPSPQCDQQKFQGGSLSVYDLQKIRMHIEHVLFTTMESGDYLMADLSLSDSDPTVAFIEGDPRRTHYLDRSTLHRLISFIKEAKATVLVRGLSWNTTAFEKKR